MGEQKRDFIYIDDVVSAYLLLLEKIDTENEWLDIRLNTGHPLTIKEFVKAVHEATHSTSKLDFGALPYRKNEIRQSTKNPYFIEESGWRIKWDLASGLRESIRKEFNK